MKILIDNACIITMDEGRIYQNGSILVENDIISYVSEALKEPKEVDKVIDAKGGIVMPGLINTHNHSAMTLLRGYSDDQELDTWLTKYIFPAEDKLDGEAAYYGSLLACAEMIKSGTTSFADMYFFSEDTVKAVLSAGMNANISRCVTGLSDDYKGRLKEANSLFAEYHGAGDGSIFVDFSAHAVYTCGKECLRAVSGAAEKNGAGIQVHVSETMKENRDCYQQNGKSPVELLRDCGIFNSRALASHCVYLSENDMDILSEHGTSIAHNPTSNLKLASGIANCKEILSKGINLALGTDGAASNNCLDMFSELKLAAILHKGMRLDPTLMDAETVLSMATVNGAKALGRENERGKLKAGMKADLIMLDSDSPVLNPPGRAVSAVVYGNCGGAVSLSMINGKIVMENKELKTIDIEAVKHGVIASTKRMGIAG